MCRLEKLWAREVLDSRGSPTIEVEAVAEAMGCRAGTVKSQTARGLDALRAAYARHGGELLVSPRLAAEAKEATR